MDLKLIGCLAVCVLNISACSDSSSLSLESAESNTFVSGEFTMSVPKQLSELRAIDLDALYAEVSLNGETKTFEQGTPITTSFSVQQGDMLTVQVQWLEDHESEASLLLTSWSTSQQVTDDVQISIDSEDFNSTGNAFDADSDGFSNLEELRADSDPRSASSTPENIPDVRIPWINSAEAPVIDGMYDSIWDSAQFFDTRGTRLNIDNLLINQGAIRPDGDTEFRWFAMHDDTNLYIFVFGESSSIGTPFRDSITVWNDDAVSLFFDGDNSKLSNYDGVDDRHAVIPLMTSLLDNSENTTVFEAGFNSAPWIENFEFATCVCSDGPFTWEFKFPLSGLDITKGEAFGFDIQLDVDTNGWARDAHWAWFHPSRTTVDIDDSWQDPSQFGTAVIE